jgi:primase-polymerase (primpol)-like protein
VLPDELLRADRWVRRSVDKAPLQVGGGFAASTRPGTWSSFAEAKASPVGVGLGFVLNGDGIVCLDLDHCLTRGRLQSWARSVLDLAPASFVEVSPSGDGLHVWGLAAFAGGFVAGRVECYSDGRYMTVTGRTMRRSQPTLGDLGPVVDALRRGEVG